MVSVHRRGGDTKKDCVKVTLGWQDCPSDRTNSESVRRRTPLTLTYRCVMSEKLIMNMVRGILCQPGVPTRVWRNNTGVLKDSRGVPVRFGLAVGSADLVGIVGPYGRFLAIECKAPDGRLTPEQTAWLQTVRDFGGIAEVARSVDDAHRILQMIKEGTIK